LHLLLLDRVDPVDEMSQSGTIAFGRKPTLMTHHGLDRWKGEHLISFSHREFVKFAKKGVLPNAWKNVSRALGPQFDAIARRRGDRMRRREFITLIGGAAVAWPLAARAQQPGKTYQVGFLTAGSGPSPLQREFAAALAALGYQEGRNLVIERRYAAGDLDRLTDLARDLVRVNVDGIVTESTPAAVAAKQVTARTPIVARLSSFDHLVCADEQSRRQVEIDRIGGFDTPGISAPTCAMPTIIASARDTLSMVRLWRAQTSLIASRMAITMLAHPITLRPRIGELQVWPPAVLDRPRLASRSH
jgi:hypothetical protein